MTKEIDQLREELERLKKRHEQATQQLQERVANLEDDRDQLRDENEELQERVDELETDNDRLLEENARLKQRISELEEQPTVEIENEKNPIGTLKIGDAYVGEAISGRVSEYDLENELAALQAELEADLEASTPNPEAEQEGTMAVNLADSSLETVATWPEDVAERELSINQQRGRYVAREIGDYAEKSSNGKWMLNSKRLASVLKARFDNGHPQTVRRVRQFLSEFGGEDVEVKKKNGITTLFFSDTLYKNLRGIAHSDRDSVQRARA